MVVTHESFGIQTKGWSLFKEDNQQIIAESITMKNVKTLQKFTVF